LREQDINLQKGFMFWKMVSVANNRIQHLEVRQGPVERHYGLASLIIYTAGTMGSDLRIPDLTLAQAQQLKAQLLNSINTEALDANEPL
jgi:membrane protein YdbS with pleckstrin-like domain